MNKITMLCLLAALSAPVFAQSTNQSSWTERIKFGGDLRLRFDSIDEDGKDTRNRARYRARVGATAEVNESIDTTLALVSGEDDPTSGNQTFGDGFSSKPVRIDLAYVDLHPDLFAGNSALIGKMRMPFIAVNDLIWDSELNPEGIAANTSFGDEQLAIKANAGSFWVEERSAENEAMLYGGQIAGVLKFENISLTAGGTLYLYEGIAGYAPVFDETTGFGNTVIAADDGSLTYAYDYELVEFFARAGFTLGLPVELSANHVDNTEVDENNSAFMAGIKLGKLKDPGSAEFSYSYREVEADSMLGVFTDSDAFGGGTDGSAHKWNAGYQIAKNVSGGATYYLSEKGLDNGKDYNRFQIDLTVKF